MYPRRGRLSGLIINLSDYPKLEFINSGAFGDVWWTVDAETDCPLALKVVKRARLTEGGIRNFGQEVDIMASAQHETLLSLRGYSPIDGPNGDLPSILMDFMPGGSLMDLLDAELGGEVRALCDDAQKPIVVFEICV